MRQPQPLLAGLLLDRAMWASLVIDGAWSMKRWPNLPQGRPILQIGEPALQAACIDAFGPGGNIPHSPRFSGFWLAAMGFSGCEGKGPDNGWSYGAWLGSVDFLIQPRRPSYQPTPSPLPPCANHVLIGVKLTLRAPVGVRTFRNHFYFVQLLGYERLRRMGA